MSTYVTVSGDTWDKIALEQMGSEYLFPLLLAANPQYRLTIMFSSEVEITIPNFELEDMYEYQRPIWLDEDLDDETEAEEELEFASEEDS
ncbi:phage tail protein [Bacillus sp. Au-Bac7]|uniref:phage tail protein n=1 Tax=Bacillus sp. Au-Bac7 TaxID=2906458 RepID=UPI001E4C0CF1|nr:phage tail protein [Bacillus sp. Au-Bac7]MCE4048020.1 phage tail protein [Bacillus sp. Au-Bac7]